MWASCKTYLTSVPKGIEVPRCIYAVICEHTVAVGCEVVRLVVHLIPPIVNYCQLHSQQHAVVVAHTHAPTRTYPCCCSNQLRYSAAHCSYAHTPAHVVLASTARNLRHLLWGATSNPSPSPPTPTFSVLLSRNPQRNKRQLLQRRLLLLLLPPPRRPLLLLLLLRKRRTLKRMTLKRTRWMRMN